MTDQDDTASGIYKITCVDTGKFYVGSAVSISRRWASHRSKLSKGIHHSIYMQRSFNKYGACALEFSILEYVGDAADLLSAEQKWIDELKPEFNTSPTAGSPLGVRHTAETRAKMSASRTGIKHSPERIAKRVAKITGVKHPPRSAGWIEKQRASHLGKAQTPESNAKRSAALKGRKSRPAHPSTARGCRKPRKG